MEFNLVEHPLDIVAELQINIDNKIEANLIDRFSSKLRRQINDCMNESIENVYSLF